MESGDRKSGQVFLSERIARQDDETGKLFVLRSERAGGIV